MNEKNLKKLLNEYNEYICIKCIKHIDNMYITTPFLCDDSEENITISSEKDILLNISEKVTTMQYDFDDIYFIVTKYFNLNKEQKSHLIKNQQENNNEHKIFILLLLLFNYKYIRFFYIINDFLYINNHKVLYNDIKDILREKELDKKNHILCYFKFLIDNLYNTYCKLLVHMNKINIINTSNKNLKNFFYEFIFKKWYYNYKLKFLLKSNKNDDNVFSLFGSCTKLICS